MMADDERRIGEKRRAAPHERNPKRPHHHLIRHSRRSPTRWSSSQRSRQHSSLVVGTRVMIRSGPYKGYRGVVKDVLNGHQTQTLRLELESQMRVVMVDARDIITSTPQPQRPQRERERETPPQYYSGHAHSHRDAAAAAKSDRSTHRHCASTTPLPSPHCPPVQDQETASAELGSTGANTAKVRPETTKNPLLIVRFKLTPEMRRVLAAPPPTKKKRPRQEPTITTTIGQLSRDAPIQKTSVTTPQAPAPIHENVRETPPNHCPTTPPLRRDATAAPIRDAVAQRKRVRETPPSHCPRTPSPLLPHDNKGITSTRIPTSPEYYAPVWIPWTPLSPTVTWSPAYDPTYDPNNPSYDPSFTPVHELY